MSDRVQNLFDARIRKVVLAYERGSGLKSIAKSVGVSPPTIAKWLTQEGYKRSKKGRVPLAMKARVRDLHKRGWGPGAIGELLNLSQDQVSEWSRPQQNPVIGGKDPLRVKGQKTKKKDKAKGLKRSGKKALPKGVDWPPPRHKCRKHWTPTEEEYVLELMKKKVKPLAIYKRMRASRKRQMRIWRKYGNEGMPPNFPPSKGPPPAPRGPTPALTPKEIQERKKQAKALGAASGKQIKMLEEAAIQRQKRIAELESQAAEEKLKIERLAEARKRLVAERKTAAKQVVAAKKALEKEKKLPGKKRRKVLPGSYEHKALGLKPGTLVEPGKPGRPALKPKSLGEYADNGRYFAVSRDWADLQDASSDELALFADFLTSKKFPAKVEKSGDQPKAYFESVWPKNVETKWNSTIDDGLVLLEKYGERKAELASKKMYSKPIARYLASAYDAYANPKLSKAQKSEAQEDMQDNWARLKKIDRLILIFNMKVADSKGLPTTKGVERGRAAKILLTKESEAAAKKLEEKKATTTRKKAIRQAEDDDVAAILAGGKSKLALPKGD